MLPVTRPNKDVIVIGSGAGGLTAALFSALGGLDVLLVEKADKLGGTLSWSGGGMWLPMTGAASRLGLADTREEVLEYLESVCEGTLDPDLIEAFLDAAPALFDAFERDTDVRMMAIPGMGDWYPEAPGAKPDGGRSLMPYDYDGKKLGKALGRLRTPLETFNAPGGFMISMSDMPHLGQITTSPKSAMRMAGLFAKFLLDKARFGRGTRLTMGNAVAAGLLKSALDAGVEMWTNAPAVDLLKEDGRIAGAVVEREGKRVEVTASRGVVLASGGFSSNPEMRRKYIPFADQHYSLTPEANTGDGIAMGRQAGGKFEEENFENGGWVVVSLVPQPDGSVIKFPHLVADRPKPGCIAVNAAGARFANEAAMDMVSDMHRSKSVPSWFVCDAHFIKKYGLGQIRPGGMGLKKLLAAGYLVEADTIPALAAKLGIDADGLAKTVERNNLFAKTGVDEDFGKGRYQGDRNLGDFAHQPNACLGPIAQAPFYGLRIYPGDSTTTLGLKVDREARVLDGEGHVIEGLYAAGLDMNSIFRGRAPGGGANNGPAAAFGFIAARSLARGVNTAKAAE